MAEQSVIIKRLTTNTILSGLNSISILNGSADDSLTIGVEGSGETITLTSGQSLTLNANTGFTLPNIDIQGSSLLCDVVYT